MMTSLILFTALLLPADISAMRPDQIQKRYTQTYYDCLKNDDAGISYNSCVYEEYSRQEVRLNQVYSIAIKQKNPGTRNRLRLSQHLWIKKRYVKCAAEIDPGEGGTVDDLVYYSCMTDKAIERTLWLEQYR